MARTRDASGSAHGAADGLGELVLAGGVVRTSLRQVLGLTVVVVAAVVFVLVGPGSIGIQGWIAVGLGGVLFSFERTRVVRQVLDRGGGQVGSGLVLLLVLGTGGTESAFQDVFILILVYGAVTRGFPAFPFDVATVGIAAAAPGVLSGADRMFWIDLVIDFTTWTLVAVVAGAIARRAISEGAAARRLRAAIDDVQDTITVVDADTLSIAYVNRSAAMAVGATPEEVRGRHPWEFESAADEETYRQFAAELETGGEGLEATHEAHGREYDTSVRKVPGDGPGPQLVFVTRDVTVQRRSERTLARQRGALLARERELNDELARVALAQRTLIQSVSHEVRTPLTAAHGFALTLATHGEAMSVEQRTEVTERLAASVERLGTLLSELLDVGDVISGAAGTSSELHDLTDLVDDAFERSGCDRAGVTVDVPPVRVRGDGARLVRGLAAVLRNAVVHGAPPISITGRVDGHDLHVEVRDGGAGIDDSIAGTAFRAFVQGPGAATRPSPGSGLGLAVALQAAQLHDGELRYEAASPGAVFHFRLPIVEPDDAPGR